eukprot:CAMPEP_0170592460 /NCGR_PEP_ID=MMETSP0224-20130122/12935_1 /TAXON_ID=285029 /ORGANISM="Togula jolla, Strain CCCM 725" /LENGTH=34 /DNA_ID= /DNA_START= /DNA_END= /DNA_ORIENTATION=
MTGLKNACMESGEAPTQGPKDSPSSNPLLRKHWD